jgi:hypothetical protein
MRRIIVYILFGLPGFQVKAQQIISSDSIYLYQQSSRQLQWTHDGATHLIFRDLTNIARSQLYAGREQGGFRRSQEAYQQTVAGFHTDGVKKLGRFYLAGQFDFEKCWEDSAAWWNAGEYNEAQPYYFFAGKAGKYDKQLYNLSATAAYNLWKNKLYLSIGGNYRYSRITRSVDPRPGVNEFGTKLRPEVTGRFGQHVIGAGLLWGRTSEDISIGYKNRDFSGNQTYVERNNFMSLGFGHIGKLNNYLQRYNETNGFFANYATRFTNWELQARGAYELWQEDISLDTTSTRNDHNLYAFLQEEKTSGNLLLNHTGSKSQQQWELNVTTQSMLNWASEFKATSYQFTATEASITYRQLWQKKKGISIELGIGCDYREQFKEDIVAAHKHQLQVITPQLYAGIYRRLAGKSSLSFSLTPSLQHTLTNELSVPVTQENYFTQGVVYTDYLYWQKNSWGVATQFNFIQKENAKRHRLGCTVNIKWQQAAGEAQTDLPALYIPSGSRWSAGASLNLYL